MRLSLGTGPLPRLLAPGTPDWIGADGERVWWAVNDVLFVLDGSGVTTAQLPDEVATCAVSAAGCTFATRYGAMRVSADGTVGAALSVDQGEPLGVVPGADCVLVLSVPEHSLVPFTGTGAIPVPDAATRARFAAPFQTGVGMVWIDLDSLYRMGADQRPQGLGRASGALALTVGPSGALLVALDDDTLCAAPGAPAVRLGEPVDVESARFSPDGLRALFADEAGIQEIDLRTARTLRRWEGTLTPVGYAPSPTWLDEATGCLTSADGNVVLGGFAGGGAALGGDWLVGPGGAVWSRSTGARLRGGLPPGVTATDGARVLVADDNDVTVLDGASFAHGLSLGADEAVELAAIVDDEVRVQTSGGALAAFSLDGTPRRREPGADWLPEVASDADAGLSEPDEPSAVRVGGVEWALPADGVLTVAGERWAWSIGGALYALS